METEAEPRFILLDSQQTNPHGQDNSKAVPGHINSPDIGITKRPSINLQSIQVGQVCRCWIESVEVGKS
jgi:hypothetical protein